MKTQGEEEAEDTLVEDGVVDTGSREGIGKPIFSILSLVEFKHLEQNKINIKSLVFFNEKLTF